MEEDNKQEEVKSLIITFGHNVKVGLPNYSSEDVYEGVKVLIPIDKMTPERVVAYYKKFAPVLREEAMKNVIERANEVRERGNVKPKIDAASIVASEKTS